MFDCFMFHNEIDLLELRLNILFPFIEKFVIVESTTTHSGKPKKLNFPNYVDRLTKFHSKICYLIHKGIEGENINSWANENNQRNHILCGLIEHHPSDNMVFISDVDEIPKPEKLFEAKCIVCKTGSPVPFNMYNCMYFMNYVSNIQYRGAYLYNPNTVKAFEESFNWPKFMPTDERWHVCAEGRPNDFIRLDDAGWHFSTMGTIEEIKYKIASFAHIEFNIDSLTSEENIRKCIAEGLPFYNSLGNPFEQHSDRYFKRDISFLPEYVQYNLDKYKKYIIE